MPSGGSRKEAHALLFWVKKGEMTEGRKATRASKTKPSSFCRMQINTFLKNHFAQPSQNVPVAGHLSTYNEISAAYFTLVRLVFRPETLAASASAACYYRQLAYYSKHFDWAVCSMLIFFHVKMNGLMHH